MTTRTVQVWGTTEADAKLSTAKFVNVLHVGLVRIDHVVSAKLIRERDQDGQLNLYEVTVQGPSKRRRTRKDNKC